ncbi:hypothetical protein G9A89_002606 [Geosiphon pyriformis]|nr:hypothetical protein G9A89_002606 [Geosiphon pyriformis]
MTRIKSKKAALDICSEISNKISTRKVFSVVKTTKQNVLEAFFLSNNCEKLPLVATEATFSSLAGFSPVKVPLKRHTWINSSVAFTLTKSPKMFNNRPEQLLASAIVIPNPFVSIIWHIIQNEPRLTTGCVVKCAKQSPSVKSSVLENWTNQMETELFFPPVSGAISSVVSTLVFGTTFKIKLSVHGYLGAKSVAKDNVKLFCLTSSVHLAIFKIAKFLVASESGSLSVAVVLHNMSLSVFAIDIKAALSVFGVVTYVVLKPASIWQYIVIHFENLVAATFALNHWSVLVDKNSVWIFLLINQQETIVFHNRFKAKLVNLSPGCIVFEISDMVSQFGGQTCFISWSPDFGHHFYFALCYFWCQEISHLAIDCKVALPPSSKALEMFKPHFVGFLSYAKTSVSPVFSEFLSLVAVASPVAILSVLAEFIVKFIGSIVKVFEQFVNGNLVSSSVLGLRVNEILVHMSIFSRTVSKLEQKVVALKTECGFKNIDMSGPYLSGWLD